MTHVFVRLAHLKLVTWSLLLNFNSNNVRTEFQSGEEFFSTFFRIHFNAIQVLTLTFFKMFRVKTSFCSRMRDLGVRVFGNIQCYCEHTCSLTSRLLFLVRICSQLCDLSHLSHRFTLSHQRRHIYSFIYIFVYT